MRTLMVVTLVMCLAAFARTTLWHGGTLREMDGANGLDRTVHVPRPTASGVLHILAAELDVRSAEERAARGTDSSE